MFAIILLLALIIHLAVCIDSDSQIWKLQAAGGNFFHRPSSFVSTIKPAEGKEALTMWLSNMFAPITDRINDKTFVKRLGQRCSDRSSTYYNKLRSMVDSLKASLIGNTVDTITSGRHKIKRLNEQESCACFMMTLDAQPHVRNFVKWGLSSTNAFSKTDFLVKL